VSCPLIRNTYPTDFNSIFSTIPGLKVQIPLLFHATISDVERLRETMQRVTDFLLECAKQEPAPETGLLGTQNNLEYN